MAESIATAFTHLINNYRFQTSNYVWFIYDHLLTLPDEVDKIWSQPFTFATLLFYINRYITHCQFIILQVEFAETTWTHSMCDRYVKFAGATTLCLVAIADMILILRVYALYFANKYVLGFLLFLLSGQIVVMAWAIHFGIRAPLPPGFPGCVLTGNNNWFGGFWVAPLITESFIFGFTVWRAMRYGSAHNKKSTLHIIVRDGTIYFFAIFSANLMNTFIYFTATEDLKALGASFSQILTSILISRLQLNLRRSRTSRPLVVTMPRNRRPTLTAELPSSVLDLGEHLKTGTFFTIGNLGEEMQEPLHDHDVDDQRLSTEISPIPLQDLRPIFDIGPQN